MKSLNISDYNPFFFGLQTLDLKLVQPQCTLLTIKFFTRKPKEILN